MQTGNIIYYRRTSPAGKDRPKKLEDAPKWQLQLSHFIWVYGTCSIPVYLEYTGVEQVPQKTSVAESQINVTSTKPRRTPAEPKDCSVLDKDRTISGNRSRGPNSNSCHPRQVWGV